MSRYVPRDKALSADDRSYLESRGGIYASLIQQLDTEYGTGVPEPEPVVEEEVQDGDGYEDMTNAQLEAMLQNRDLSKSGTKTDLIARLRASDAGE